MAFNDVFHQFTPNQRNAGRNISFVRKYVVQGGLNDGKNALQVGLLFNSDIVFIEESPDPEITSHGFRTLVSVEETFQAMFSQGLSEIVPGQLLANPQAISSLDYSDVELKAAIIGVGGVWEFRAASVSTPTPDGNHKWAMPAAEFEAFKVLALQRLSTLPGSTQASSYIAFNGGDDYINFSGGNNTAGFMDWSKNWALGITLVGFPQHSDSKYQCLFASGNNVLMIRRGGTNQALYIASNNTGYASQGINTWAPINDGDRLYFAHDASTHRLKYFKAQQGSSPILVGTLTVNATNIANNDPGDDFAIGRGNGKTNYEELLHWDGGINNFIGMQSSFGATDLNSYYQSIGEEFSEQSWYSDLTSFAGLGEDSYPTVVDTLGALTGGELVNGTEEDFVPIE